MSAVTIGLGLLAVAAIVYFVGVDSTKEYAAKTSKAAKSSASRTVGAGVGGAVVGLQFGDQLVNAILADPGFALNAVAGFMGALGIGGFLGDITAVQFLLIGLVAFVTVYAVFGGDD
ncbi:hypothetical protein EXE43_05635 [Halorubrum sp. SS5]|nr:hypothetical protein EXE43_05635 [Halorubrum sp. SS5]